MLISPQRWVSARRSHGGATVEDLLRGGRSHAVARVLWSIPAGGPLSRPLRCCCSLLLTGQWRVLREYCSALLPHSSLPNPNPIVSSAEECHSTARWFDRDSGLQRAQRLPSRECSGACGTAAVGLGSVPRERASEGSGSHTLTALTAPVVARSVLRAVSNGKQPWRTSRLVSCGCACASRYSADRTLLRDHGRSVRPVGEPCLRCKLNWSVVASATQCDACRIASHRTVAADGASKTMQT
jgi:hypothetical protein